MAALPPRSVAIDMAVKNTGSCAIRLLFVAFPQRYKPNFGKSLDKQEECVSTALRSVFPNTIFYFCWSCICFYSLNLKNKMYLRQQTIKGTCNTYTEIFFWSTRSSILYTILTLVFKNTNRIINISVPLLGIRFNRFFVLPYINCDLHLACVEIIEVYLTSISFFN